MTEMTGMDAPESDQNNDGQADGSAIGSTEIGTGHELVFRGNAAEYFRIWIINLVLSIVTLGIYSAWATVRNRRYFYGNTDLAGQSFDFHGKPVAILKGRVLAVVVLLAYAFGTEFHWMITLGALAIIALGFPWVLVRALRFRLANTSHRGLRFGFRGTAAEAYRRLGPILLIGALVLGFYLWTAAQIDLEDQEALARSWPQLLSSLVLLIVVNLALIPVLWFRIRNFSMNNSYFGRHGFKANIRLGVFWRALVVAVGLGMLAAIAVIGVSIFLAMLTFSAGGAEQNLYLTLILVYGVTIVAYLAPFAAWYCIINNHVFSNTRLEQLSFNMRLDGVLFWWILVSNAVIAVLTLGMGIPWARVRMHRYKLSCLTLAGDLDGFLADSAQDPGAFGDELGQAFDLDFGF